MPEVRGEVVVVKLDAGKKQDAKVVRLLHLQVIPSR
jgi:hypothetical protein